jgi:hypothetical protein
VFNAVYGFIPARYQQNAQCLWLSLTETKIVTCAWVINKASVSSVTLFLCSCYCSVFSGAEPKDEVKNRDFLSLAPLFHIGFHFCSLPTHRCLCRVAAISGGTCCFYPEDGNCLNLRNIGNIGHSRTVLRLKRRIDIGGSLVRFPIRSLDFSIGLIFPAALRPWGRLSLYYK